MVSNKQNKDTVQPKPQIGKDEMNLAELPIAKLGSRDKRGVIEFTGEIVKDGKTITQEWAVSGTVKFGLPTEFAERVLVALISLAAVQGFQSRKTTFTTYEVLKLMGLSICGYHYQEVLIALQRLHGVTITGKNTWWDNDIKKYRTINKGFGRLIENFWLESQSDEDDDKTQTGVGGYVLWDAWLWESFQAGYVKNLDTAFYYGLDSTLARRLYRFLDKRMHYQDSYQIDIFALAARLGMATYRYPSKVKEKLQPAFDELIARDYLASADEIKVGKFTRIKFVRVGAKQAYQASLWDDPSATPAQIDREGHISAESASDGETGVETRNGALAVLYADYGTSDHLQNIWQDILHECAGTMPTDSHRMIAGSALLDVSEETAIIAINASIRNWAERQMRRKFLVQLSQYLGSKVREIRFIDIVSVEAE